MKGVARKQQDTGQMEIPKGVDVLAIFDLDGTLTVRDTFLQYLYGFMLRHPSKFLALPKLVTGVVEYKIGKLTNTKLKCLFLNEILAGASRGELDRWTRTFARTVVTAGLRPQALPRLDEHRRQGNRIILATASLDLYAVEIGRLLAVDKVVATEVVWQADGRLGRNLAGANLRGPAKLDMRQQSQANFG